MWEQPCVRCTMVPQAGQRRMPSCAARQCAGAAGVLRCGSREGLGRQQVVQHSQQSAARAPRGSAPPSQPGHHSPPPAPHLLCQVQQGLILLGAQRARLRLRAHTRRTVHRSDSGRRLACLLAAAAVRRRRRSGGSRHTPPRPPPHLVLLAGQARVPGHAAVGAELLVAVRAGDGRVGALVVRDLSSIGGERRAEAGRRAG